MTDGDEVGLAEAIGGVRASRVELVLNDANQLAIDVARAELALAEMLERLQDRASPLVSREGDDEWKSSSGEARHPPNEDSYYELLSRP